MTSELKPNYEEFSLEICQIAFEGGDADGASIQDIGVKHGVLREEIFNHKKHSDVVNAEYFEDGQTVYCFVAPHAVPEGVHTKHTLSPDVPELVAVSHEVFYAPTREWRRTVEPEYYRKNGDLVRDLIDKSKAAAMLAAKDNLISGLNDELQFMRKAAKENRQRAEAAEAELSHLKHSIRVRSSQEELATVAMRDRLEIVAGELHDTRTELDRIKAQKIIGYFDGPHFSEEPREGWLPLYAAPVDQTAEIEQLRSATTDRMD